MERKWMEKKADHVCVNCGSMIEWTQGGSTSECYDCYWVYYVDFYAYWGDFTVRFCGGYCAEFEQECIEAEHEELSEKEW